MFGRRDVTDFVYLIVSVFSICVTTGLLSVMGASQSFTFTVGLIMTYVFGFLPNAKKNLALVDIASDKLLGR